MAVKLSPTVLAIFVALVCMTSPLKAQQPESFDVKKEARGLVATVRQVVMRAKEGSPLASILQSVIDVQNITSNLVAQLPNDSITECKVQAVIQMAAAAVGSHEVLGVMLAEGTVNVLSARLGLALAFVNHVTQQLEDKLSRSSDVGPELTAIVFGTKTTASIINSADQKIQEKLNAVDQGTRGKRGAVLSLGRGFDFNDHVILWKDTPGKHTFHIYPYLTRHYPEWHHLYARSPDGWTGGLKGIGDFKEGGLEGLLGWTSKNGKFSAGITGGLTWGPGGLKPSAGIGLTFKF